MESLLYKTSPRDPVVTGDVASLLIITAGIAALLPALRATRVDPTVALPADWTLAMTRWSASEGW
jgi:ABC-type lipoprotein release transport system permease subunit